jgi:hypothetical protein
MTADRNEIAPWSDLDWALFLLDAAEQAIVDQFHGSPDPRGIGLLATHRDRIKELRREYVIAERPGDDSSSSQQVEG